MYPILIEMKKKSNMFALSCQGFTLIEIIAVLITLGILSAIVVSRSGTFTTGTAVTTEAEILKSDLRYAQMKSMNSKSGEIWQVTFPDASRYTLQHYNSATWANKYLPGQTSDTHVFADNINATSSPTVRYDNWGTPVQSDKITAEGANLTITLSDGTNSRTITVTKNTGFTYLP